MLFVHVFFSRLYDTAKVKGLFSWKYFKSQPPMGAEVLLFISMQTNTKLVLISLQNVPLKPLTQILLRNKTIFQQIHSFSRFCFSMFRIWVKLASKQKRLLFCLARRNFFQPTQGSPPPSSVEVDMHPLAPLGLPHARPYVRGRCKARDEGHSSKGIPPSDVQLTSLASLFCLVFGLVWLILWGRVSFFFVVALFGFLLVWVAFRTCYFVGPFALPFYFVGCCCCSIACVLFFGIRLLTDNKLFMN